MKARLRPWREEEPTSLGESSQQLPSVCEGGHDLETPILAGNESYEWAAIPNLDVFFTRLYRYWACKGLRAMALAGVLNLAALAFTVAFSGFLLLGVNWPELLTAECIEQETCDIIDVALYPHVLKSRGLAADVLLLTYLLIFGSYWAWSVVHFLNDIRDMVEIRHFVSNKLGCSDRRMSMMTWAELLHKVVMVQQTTRLCITRDLDEHAVVSRVMRKDNYLIALINKGVLRLAPPPLLPTLTVALRGAAGKTALGLEAASTLAHRAAQLPGVSAAEERQHIGSGDTHAGRGMLAARPANGPMLGGYEGLPAAAGAHSSRNMTSGSQGGVPASGQALANGGIREGMFPNRESAGARAEEGAASVKTPLMHRDSLQGCAGDGSLTQDQRAVENGSVRSHSVMGSDRWKEQAWAAARAAAAACVWCGLHALWGLALLLWGGSVCLQKLSRLGESGSSRGTSWRLRAESGVSKFSIGGSNGLALLGGRRPLLTKTLEWNLRWCLLDHMFDDQFCVKRSFLEKPEMLKKRFRTAALINAALSPFLLLFLLLYFFMRNAEHFYHHPGAAGSRRWSALARWRLRELNELPHYCSHRLDAAHAPACHYCAQFPSYSLASSARFVSFVVGSFTALLLLVTLLDEKLLERPLFGRHVVWWLATLGVVLTASRSFMNENPTAYDPERAMQEVVAHTHHLPRQWRGRAHTLEVQQAFNQLFQYKVLLFLEELASVILTPFMLFYTLPQCADDIVAFVGRFTTHIEGVGDICSLAAFNLQEHGNHKYGAPTMHVSKADKSRQGKMEKSFLTFVATYPTWEPGPAGKAMLLSLTQQQQQQQQQQQMMDLSRPASSPSLLSPSPTFTSPRVLPSFHAAHRPLRFPPPPPRQQQQHLRPIMHQHQHQQQQHSTQHFTPDTASAPPWEHPHTQHPYHEHQQQQQQQQQQQEQQPRARSVPTPGTHQPSRFAPHDGGILYPGMPPCAHTSSHLPSHPSTAPGPHMLFHTSAAPTQPSSVPLHMSSPSHAPSYPSTPPAPPTSTSQSHIHCSHPPSEPHHQDLCQTPPSDLHQTPPSIPHQDLANFEGPWLGQDQDRPRASSTFAPAGKPIDSHDDDSVDFPLCLDPADFDTAAASYAQPRVHGSVQGMPGQLERPAYLQGGNDISEGNGVHPRVGNGNGEGDDMGQGAQSQGLTVPLLGSHSHSMQSTPQLPLPPWSPSLPSPACHLQRQGRPLRHDPFQHQQQQFHHQQQHEPPQQQQQQQHWHHHPQSSSSSLLGKHNNSQAGTGELQSHALQPDPADLCEDEWDSTASLVHSSLFGAPAPSPMLLPPPPVCAAGGVGDPLLVNTSLPTPAHTTGGLVTHGYKGEKPAAGDSGLIHSAAGGLGEPLMFPGGLPQSRLHHYRYQPPHPQQQPCVQDASGLSSPQTQQQPLGDGVCIEDGAPAPEPPAQGLPGLQEPSPQALQDPSPHCSIYLGHEGEGMHGSSSNMQHSLFSTNLAGSASLRRGRSSGFGSSSSMLLPTNEGDDLVRRLVQGHGALQNLYERTDHTIMHRYMAAAAQPGGPRHRFYGAAGSGLWGPGGYGGHAAGMGIIRASSPGFDLH